MIIRDLKYDEIATCEALAMFNWGDEAADRCRMQAIEMFKGGPYAPHFYVAVRESDVSDILGFAAFQPSMRMNGAYDFIWVAVRPECQSEGVGRHLTLERIAEVTRRGGAFIELSTQKPHYFAQFGFITIEDLGNGWQLMIRRLKPAEM